MPRNRVRIGTDQTCVSSAPPVAARDAVGTSDSLGGLCGTLGALS